LARIFKTAPATHDFNAIWWKIFHDSGLEVADKVTKGIDKTIEQLAEFPKIGRLKKQYRYPVYVMPAGPFVIVYTFEDDLVTVIRIVHEHQQLERLI